MALPRNGCIIKTTYLGYLDTEPTATCSAISHIAASIHEGLLKAPAQRPAPRMPGSISSQAAISTTLVGPTAATTTPWPLSPLHGCLRRRALLGFSLGALYHNPRRSTVERGTGLK